MIEKVEIPTIYFTPFKHDKASSSSFHEYWSSYSHAKGPVTKLMSTTNTHIDDKCHRQEKLGWLSKRNSGGCEVATDLNDKVPSTPNRKFVPPHKQRSNVSLKSYPKWHKLFPLIILTFLSLFCQVSEECPTACECKWKSGKESVVCANSKTKLTSIPTGLDPGTQLLDLSKNNIQLLKSKVFHSHNLLNLQKIFLPECNLKTLEINVFFKLNNLVELDLSKNRIDSIPTHTFEQIPELRELKLNSNPISKVSTNAFSSLTRLVRLELSRCRIALVDSAAFRGLASLEWLKLDNNRLLTVQVVSFYPLRNLHGLEVHGNDWSCNCTLLPLKDWMTKNNVPYGVPPVCSEPSRLAGKPWDQLQREDFACLPVHQNSLLSAATGGELTKSIEGQNATLVCRLQATADTQVRWMNGNKPISISSLRYSLSESFTQATIEGDKQTSTIYSGGKLALGTKTSKLTVIRTKMKDSGIYSCRAETRAGSVSANFTLQVHQLGSENHSGQLLLYAAAIAIVTLSLCILLLCVVFYCGRQRTRILTEDKIELNHVGQNGRLAQNGHSPHTRNGGTAIPLLQNHNNVPNNSLQNTPSHRSKIGGSNLNSLNLNKRSNSVITNSTTANNHSTNGNGLLNKRYKALPTSDTIADEQNDSSSDVGENDDNESENERKFSRVGVHKKFKTAGSTVSQVVNNTKRGLASSSMEQKFPDLINTEESPSHNVLNKKCENNGPVRNPPPPVPQKPPRPSPPVAKAHMTNRDHNTSLPTHRRSNSESESHSHFPRLKLVPNGNSPKIGACPSTSASSVSSNFSKNESPYGSTSTYQTVLSTPPAYSKFTFTQRPTPPKRALPSFSTTIAHNNQNPHQSYYYRQQQSREVQNPFQRRSMPTSPIHYNQHNSLHFHNQSENPTSKFSQGQGSDPGLTNQEFGSPEEYDYHAVQLASFLEEYRQLQMELMRMSASLTEMEPSSSTNINANNPIMQSDSLAVRVIPNSNLNFGLNSAEQFQQQEQMKSILKSSGTNNNYLV